MKLLKTRRGITKDMPNWYAPKGIADRMINITTDIGSNDIRKITEIIRRSYDGRGGK